MITMVLLILATIFWVLATAGVPQVSPRIAWGWLGLVMYGLSLLIRLDRLTIKRTKQCL